ncbi:unnamed protein product [Scytosiphon promiscuus]
MEGLVKDALLQVLRYFHNPELIGSLLLLYVIYVVGLTVNIPHLFMNGLKFIVAPTEDAVLRVRSDAKGPRPDPLGQLDKEGKEANAYDKMNALGLARMEISRGTLGTLMFFPEYEGLVIWSLVAIGNFVIAQGSRCVVPTQSPLGWASLTIVAALLRAWWCNVRLMYLLGVGNDHAKFAVLCGFCGLFAAAAVTAGGLSPSTNLFAFDLRAAAGSLYAWGRGVSAALSGWGGSEGGGRGISEDDFVAAIFLPAVAVTAACATAAAALPAIRFAQYFNRSLGRDSGASFLHRTLLVADAVLPWLATLSWITAFQHFVVGSQSGEGRAGGRAASLRIGLTGLAAAARLAVGRLQLQAYLEGVKQSVLKELREKKVSPQAVRLKFDARFQYLMIAAAQYAAPALTVLLAMTLLVHVGGGSGAAGLGGASASLAAAPGANGAASVGGVGLGVCDAARRVVGLQPWDTALAAAAAATGAPNSGGSGPAGGLGAGVSTAGSLANLAARIPGSPHRAFLSGAAGFLAWWACLSWAVTYAIGVGFWWLFPEDESAVERSRTDTTTKGKKEKVKGKAKAKNGGRGAAGAGGKG